MSVLIDKAGFAAQMYNTLLAHAQHAEEDIDGMRLLQVLSGILIETLLLFDNPDEGLMATMKTLSEDLGTAMTEGELVEGFLPPAFVIDSETETGRGIARELFEEWLDCAWQFHDLVCFTIQNVIVRMEEAGQPRAETLRLLWECSRRCLAYEIAAQELCDIVIEDKIGKEGWDLNESVSGLSAVAGRCLGLSRNSCEIFSVPSLPESLDHVSYVMTQEAVRLGIPAGTDWRFGLAANDGPVSAPFELIFNLWPICQDFFEVIALDDIMDQAVACAKAAGRMLAVAAGGEVPEIEPVVAKPLAMAAMTDTYKTVCQESGGKQKLVPEIL